MMRVYILQLAIVLSFVQVPLAAMPQIPGLDRLSIFDILVAICLVVSVPQVIRGGVVWSRQSIFVLLLCVFSAYLLASVGFSYRPIATLVEAMIVVFLSLFFLLCISVFGRSDGQMLFRLIYAVAVAVSLAFFVGLYDVLAPEVGLPRIFPARAIGEVVSGFRNAGQAGNYAFVCFAILLSFRASGLDESNSQQNRLLVTVGIVASLLLLLLSGKIAAYFAVAVSLILFLGLFGRRSIFLVALGAVLLVVGVYTSLPYFAPSIKDRIDTKFSTRIIDRYTGNYDSDNFLDENWSLALTAFSDRPMVGTGLGAFYTTYSNHEVHSTYLKLLGETGLIGTTLYLSLLISWYRPFRNAVMRKDKFARMARMLIPFFAGSAVSWIYTYHLRKREFWIMLVVAAICVHVSNSKSGRRFMRRNAQTASSSVLPTRRVARYKP